MASQVHVSTAPVESHSLIKERLDKPTAFSVMALDGLFKVSC